MSQPSARKRRQPDRLQAETAEALLQRREDQWFDRKSSRVSARGLADAMIAFANAEGGTIAIGLSEGKVEGVDASALVHDWRQAAVNFTQPPVRHTVALLPCANVRGSADHVMLVEIEPGELVHCNNRDEVFLRVGDESRKLKSFETAELRYDKGSSVYDGQPVNGATRADLDDDLVAKYLRRMRPRTPSDEALAARGLLTITGRVEVPSVAGYLLLAAHPQRLFPEAMVRVLTYQGLAREAGARGNVREDRRFEGAIGAQIEAARRFVRRRLVTVTRLEPGGKFAAVTLIPEAAWLEAIVNALTHRSYSMAGDHVRVEIFADRLEVESPGRLPGIVRVENIRSTRFARNPRIARAVADLGYGRELGEGVDRMFEEMRRVGLPEPVYEQRPASVRVTLWGGQLSAAILDALPPRAERVLDFLGREGRMTTTEALQLLGMSRPTVLAYLQRLADLQVLEHVGTSRKDPRGYWRRSAQTLPRDASEATQIPLGLDPIESEPPASA